MVDKASWAQSNLTSAPARGDSKPEERVEVKTETSCSVIQAVADANRELSAGDHHHHHHPDTREDSGPADTEEAARRRTERALVRRPSYRKILTELGGSHNMISEDKEAVSEGESGGSSEDHQDRLHHHHHHFPAHPGLRGSLLSNGGGVTGVESLQHPGHAPGHALYSEQQQPHHPPFFVPAMAALGAQSGMASPGPDEGSRKREIRLLKNREAARECRRKKKEYIKCLENRVAVLENQNKALIEELKSLKELYTGSGNKIM